MRTPHDDASDIIVIVVVIASLVAIALASIFLSLPGRHTTVAPSRLLAFVPSRRHAFIRTVTAVLVITATFPAIVITVSHLILFPSPDLRGAESQSRTRPVRSRLGTNVSTCVSLLARTSSCLLRGVYRNLETIQVTAEVRWSRNMNKIAAAFRFWSPANIASCCALPSSAKQ